MIAVRCTLPTSDIFRKLNAQEVTTTRWKKTRFGWEDSTLWEQPAPIEAERRIELIHPLLFSAFLILVTTGFLIWSSEERHWEEFVQPGLSEKKNSPPNPCASTTNSD